LQALQFVVDWLVAATVTEPAAVPPPEPAPVIEAPAPEPA
jgi:hypothetical protein